MPVWLIWVVAPAFVALMILVPAIRATVFNRLNTARNYATPTLQDVWATLRTIAIWILILLVASGIFFSVGILVLGFYANAPIRGIIIGILFPIWCILYIIRPGREVLTENVSFFRRIFRGIRRPFQIPYLITTIILLIALPGFLLGVWSPLIKSSADRRVGTLKEHLANSLDKGSAQSEAESGIFARIKEETVLGSPVSMRFLRKLEAGTKVKVMSLEGRPSTPDAEGFTRVMLPDQYGRFLNGQEGWVPSRNLEWDLEDENKEAEGIDLGKLKGTVISSATSAPGLSIERSIWEICFKEEAVKSCQEFVLEFITKKDEKKSVFMAANGTVFTGLSKSNEYEYSGTWSQNETGTTDQPFELRFSPSFKSIENGWAIRGGKRVSLEGNWKR